MSVPLSESDMAFGKHCVQGVMEDLNFMYLSYLVRINIC